MKPITERIRAAYIARVKDLNPEAAPSVNDVEYHCGYIDGIQDLSVVVMREALEWYSKNWGSSEHVIKEMGYVVSEDAIDQYDSTLKQINEEILGAQK